MAAALVSSTIGVTGSAAFWAGAGDEVGVVAAAGAPEAGADSVAGGGVAAAAGICGDFDTLAGSRTGCSGPAVAPCLVAGAGVPAAGVVVVGAAGAVVGVAATATREGAAGRECSSSAA